MGLALRRLAARTLLAGLALSATLAAEAHAGFVYTDIVDFNLTETTTSYGGGTQFHISSIGDGTVSYRWVDFPVKATVISGNSCSDLSPFGSHYYNAGVTDYRLLFSGFNGLCFILRGRTAAGQGSMTYYDGRLRR